MSSNTSTEMSIEILHNRRIRQEALPNYEEESQGIAGVLEDLSLQSGIPLPGIRPGRDTATTANSIHGVVDHLSGKSIPTSNAHAADAQGIYIGQSSISGKGLFASKKYGEGQAIISLARPLVAALDPERLKDTCSHCFLWTEGASFGTRLYVPEGSKTNACGGCHQARYCSKKCQKGAWGRYHKLECGVLKRTNGKQLPKVVRATIELLIRRAGGSIDDETWSSMMELESHAAELRSESEKWSNVELMARGALEFSGTKEKFTHQTAINIITKIISNSLTLVTQSFDPLGIVFDPVLCRANHSCDPNAFVVMDGSEVSIRTLRSIRKDEEISISYIDTTSPYSRRQWELEKRWHFKCKCTKCQKGPMLREDKLGPVDDQLQSDWEPIAVGLIEQGYADDPANFVGNSQAERRIAALQGKAYEGYEAAFAEENPKEALKILEQAVTMCYKTNIWSIDRQPWPSMRDLQIANLAVTGDYKTAFLHAVKRSNFISPVLYTKKHHPNRVIQEWEMVMLLLYFAGRPEDPFTRELGEKGYDLYAIATSMLFGVHGDARRSHGESSSFAKSVKDKMNEVNAELRRVDPTAPMRHAMGIDSQMQKFAQLGLEMQY